MPNHVRFLLPSCVFTLHVLLCLTPGWSQKTTPWLSQPTHTWWHSKIGLHNLPQLPKIGAAGDFNGDGHEDVVASDQREVYVAWNSDRGLGTWQKIALPSDRINRLLWDSVDQVLWIEYFSPGFIEARRWREGAWRIEATFEGSPVSVSLSEGTGLVALKRLGLELELLRPSGAHEVLIQRADDLSSAFYWEDELMETKTLVVKDKMTGRLGWVASNGSSWNDIEWWNDTNITVQWQAQTRISDSGTPIIEVLGMTEESLWFKSFDPVEGGESTSWQAQAKLGEVRFHQPRFSAPGRLIFISHNPMTYAARVYELDANTGEILQQTALEELAKMNLVLDIDLNADGTREWMYPGASSSAWSIVTDWSPLSKRWMWRNPHVDTQRQSADSDKLGQGWTDALKELDGIQEVWMHEGAILVRDSAAWWIIERRPLPNTETSLAEPPTAPHSHQLVLPYLELGDRGTGDQIPGIAEIQPHQWHHLAFSRSEHNHTQVWLDGKTVFRGKSKDLNYLYNAILVGAYFESHWITHGAVSVDNMVLSGELWTEDEVSALHLYNQELGPARYSERWEFEDATFKSERRKREMTAYSNPKLDAGVDGMGVTLDGIDDALRTFLAVPQKGLSLSFAFRFNEEKPSRPHTVATLYGMFNTWFNVVWQPKAFLASPDVQTGVVTTPSSCMISPAPWPAKSSAFVMDDMFMVIDSANFIWQNGPLGWESRVTPPSGMDARRGDVWVVNECMHLLDESNAIWRWSPNEGWTTLGTAHLPAHLKPTATEHGVLFASDSTWSLWGDPSLSGTSSAVLDPNVLDVVHSPAGELFHFSNGEMAFGGTPWTRYGNPTPPLLKSHQGRWTWLVFLTLALSFLAWRIRIRTMPEGERSLDLPSELLVPLQSWIAQGGLPMDAQGLDDLLSDATHETEETRRGRRSRFVRELNQLGQEQHDQDLIHRGKDTHDRRRVVYELDAKVIDLLSMGEDAQKPS